MATVDQQELAHYHRMFQLDLESIQAELESTTDALIAVKDFERRIEDYEAELGLHGNTPLACEAWDVIECERIPALLRQARAIIGSEAFKKLVEGVL